jgi:hypothetical protein
VGYPNRGPRSRELTKYSRQLQVALHNGAIQMADQLFVSENHACIAELRDNIRWITKAAALSAPENGDPVVDRIEQASIEVEEPMTRRNAVLASTQVRAFKAGGPRC